MPSVKREQAGIVNWKPYHIFLLGTISEAVKPIFTAMFTIYFRQPVKPEGICFFMEDTPYRNFDISIP